MSKPQFSYKTLNELTGKRSVKTKFKVNIENKDSINSPIVFADMFNKKLGNFATTVEGATTQELKKCFKIVDNNLDNMFAFPTNITEVFNA